MFKNNLVAYDKSHESGRALLTAIEKLSPYAGYIDAELPGGTAPQKQASDYNFDMRRGIHEQA